MGALWRHVWRTNAVFIAEGIAVSFENEQEGTAAEPEEAVEPKKSASKSKRKSRKTQ